MIDGGFSGVHNSLAVISLTDAKKINERPSARCDNRDLKGEVVSGSIFPLIVCWTFLLSDGFQMVAR